MAECLIQEQKSGEDFIAIAIHTLTIVSVEVHKAPALYGCLGHRACLTRDGG